jgi:hypothetical protein
MFPTTQILVLSQPEFVRRQVQDVMSGRWPGFWKRRAAQ